MSLFTISAVPLMVLTQQTLNTERIYPFLTMSRGGVVVVIVVVDDAGFLAAEVSGLGRGQRGHRRPANVRELGLLSAVAAPLSLPVPAQRLDVHVDAFQRQLLLLLFQRLDDFALFAVALFPLQLLGRNGFAAAGLGMRVVGRSARSLFRVVLLAPLGPPVLEPHLLNTTLFLFIDDLVMAFNNCEWGIKFAA